MKLFRFDLSIGRRLALGFTILAALIMFQFGAGPVKGFAWTLSIGVVTSVFTAVLITQFLLALWFRTARPKTLPIV